MRTIIHTPRNAGMALRCLRTGLRKGPAGLARREFIRIWHSIAYLHPGLHPDDYKAAGSGWPRKLKPFATEAWRRAEAGKLADEELYPAHAAWAGLRGIRMRSASSAAHGMIRCK